MSKVKKAEYSIGHENISIKASTTVKLSEYFEIQTQDGPIDVIAKIECDFADIPDKYHEIVLNLLTSKYLNKVSCGDNPFSECKPIIKRKWWEFWKEKYIQIS